MSPHSSNIGAKPLPNRSKATALDDFSVSIIVPVHNGGDNFIKCLTSISQAEPPPLELIVVADGNSDGYWKEAEKFNARIIKLDQPSGPAKARNMGAEVAKGTIIFFIDADVTIPPATVGIVLDFFREHPDVSAIMGSYDDTPLAANFLSQYKNLFHHYVHQNANPKAATFWSACGAVRSDIFAKMNGFDEMRFRPSGGACPGTIEDVELGYRITEAGYSIYLLKNLQVKHLKRWEFLSLLKTEIFYRALPWTELLLSKGRMINTLNIDFSNRLSTVLVYLLLLCIPATLTGLPTIPAALSICLFLLLINWRCYLFFAKKRGIAFSALVVPWHWLYFFYSGGTFLLGSIFFRLQGKIKKTKSDLF